eukprot:3657967-Rhodomonas_salina.3
MGHMPVFTRSSVVCETEPDRELLNGSAQRATMNNRPELFVAKVKGWPWWPAKHFPQTRKIRTSARTSSVVAQLAASLARVAL